MGAAKKQILFSESPKEKAAAIFNEAFYYFTIDRKLKCYYLALSIVKQCQEVHFNLNGDNCGIGESFKYWNEVQSELEKLKPNN